MLFVPFSALHKNNLIRHHCNNQICYIPTDDALATFLQYFQLYFSYYIHTLRCPSTPGGKHLNLYGHESRHNKIRCVLTLVIKSVSSDAVSNSNKSSFFREGSPDIWKNRWNVLQHNRNDVSVFKQNRRLFVGQSETNLPHNRI